MIFEQIQNNGPIQVVIKQEIHMGDVDSSDTHEFVASQYLRIDNGEIYIKAGQEVTASYVESNGCVELMFDELSSCDIIMDHDDEFDEYLEVVA